MKVGCFNFLIFNSISSKGQTRNPYSMVCKSIDATHHYT